MRLLRETLDSYRGAANGLKNLRIIHKDGGFVSSEGDDDSVIPSNDLYPDDE